MEDIEGVLGTITGAAPGKRVVVFGSVHGDEPCGAEAIRRIMPTLKLARGSATFVLGNPRAIERKVRFTEANLNRMFREDAVLSDEKKASYEYRRSRELMPLLASADALLDIHSSESPVCDPFVICTERSREYAVHMPFPIISWGWDAIEPGGTDDFMDRLGKIGIGVECGYDNDPASADRAEQALYRFLEVMELIEPSEMPMPEQRQIKAVYAHLPTTNFAPAAMVPDFTSVRAGHLIGTDGDVEMRAPQDGYLIFVRKRTAPGQEAYIFAIDG